MLRFPDCNQYLRKNLFKVPDQSIPKASEIWNKALWPGFQKTPILQERTFQQMVRKGPQTRHAPRLHLDSLFSIFSDLAGPCRPDTPKRYLLYHFVAKKSSKSYIGLLFDAFLLHRFCLHTCACASSAQVFLCICCHLLWATSSLPAAISGKAHAWCAKLGGAAMQRRRRLR